VLLIQPLLAIQGRGAAWQWTSERRTDSMVVQAAHELGGGGGRCEHGGEGCAGSSLARQKCTPPPFLASLAKCPWVAN
jgi:hypothetical protein